MEILKRFRLLAVRLGLLLSMIAGAVAYKYDYVIAKSILMGGVAGVLGFWVVAVKLEKLALGNERDVRSSAVSLAERSLVLWRMAEMVLYVAVLWRAYTQAGGQVRGLLAAACGLFIIRVVVVILGMTGLDLKRMDD